MISYKINTKLLKQVIKEFKDLNENDQSQLQIERMPGLTNKVFKITYNNFSVIYRIFNHDFDIFLNRTQEN